MSRAATVEQYLAELPADRRGAIERVRRVVLDNLPEGYRETMLWGMIAYGVPLETYPQTYNGQPLCYVALASQKNYLTLYLMGAYADPVQRARLERAYIERGRRFDMGKSCLTFKQPDDLPLDLIAELVASKTPDDMIALVEARRRQATGDRPQPTTERAAAKQGATKRRADKKAAPKKKTAKRAVAKKPASKKSAVRKAAAKKSAAKKAPGRKSARKR